MAKKEEYELWGEEHEAILIQQSNKAWGTGRFIADCHAHMRMIILYSSQILGLQHINFELLYGELSICSYETLPPCTQQ
jgi:hypothetical protein